VVFTPQAAIAVIKSKVVQCQGQHTSHIDDVVEAEAHKASAGGAKTLWSTDSIQQAPSSKALLFESRQQRFAIATDTVVEVIEAPQWTSVPAAPWWFCGVAAYRAHPVS